MILKIFKYLTILSALLNGGISYGQWNTITTDVIGDGANFGLLDGTLLEYRYDIVPDSLWFRLTCAGINATQSSDLGFNIMVNYPGGGTTFNFWGTSVNNGNPYHRLVSGWVTGTPPSAYAGTVGIADPAGVAASAFTNLFANNLTIIVDQPSNSVTVGMNRSDLIPNSALGQPILTAAAVGASNSWNDDIYSANGIMTLNANNNDPNLVAGFISKPVICEQECITMTDTTFGTPVTWQWAITPVNAAIPSMSNLQNPEFCFINASNNVSVQLTVTNADGSFSQATQILNVVNNPTVIAPKDTVIDLGEPAILNVTSIGATYFSWEPSESLTRPSSSSTFAYPEETTNYFIKVEDSNGCFAKDSVTVYLNFSPQIGVPTAFSPNGDGKNDILVVEGLALDVAIFKIYNRYGIQIFESTNQKNGWDGNYKGRPESPGVYYWTLDYEFNTGQKGKLSGNTTLIR